MRQRAVLVISLIFLMLGPAFLQVAAAADSGRSTIAVVLCNLAGLNVADRAEAKGQASRILASANISIDWVESCEGVARPTYYSLIIAAKHPSDWDPGAMGRAVVLTGPHPRAYVFMDLVKAFDSGIASNSSAHEQAILLGHAMAHELGHLLGRPHSVNGIMTGTWGHREWRDALAGTLLFARLIPVSR